MHFEKDIYYSNPCSIPQKHWGGCGDRWLTKDDTRQHHIFGNFAKFLFGPDGTLLDTLEYESGTEAFASAAAFDKWMDDVAVPTIQSMLANIE